MQQTQLKAQLNRARSDCCVKMCLYLSQELNSQAQLLSFFIVFFVLFDCHSDVFTLMQL